MAATVVAAVAVGAIAALFLAAGGTESRGARANERRRAKPERQVENIPYLGKAVTLRQIDPRRGLIFELESTPALRSGGLTIKLADDAPSATRVAVHSHLLGATCRVPGRDVHEHVGQWDEHLDQFATSLEMDDTSIVIADTATSCALYVGRPTDTPGRETFLDPPFSRVAMR
jgi:hypothetical protein